MKTSKKIRLIAILGSVFLLSACGGDSDVVTAPPGVAIAPGGSGGVTLPIPGPTTVPPATSNSIASFIAYLAGLSMTDEKAEPSPIADSFAVPDNETSDPQVLS